MYKILITDIETENEPYHGHPSSPHNPTNYIVAPGWRVDTVNDDGTVSTGEVQYRYFTSKEDSVAGSDWFAALDDCSIMVCHNASFEIQWFLTYYRERLENFIRKGGRILDTALAEYLLSDQTEMYPKLDEVAPRYGGTHKIDGVKILWEQGVRTSAIDKDLLIEYLAGPSGDIDNTGLVFYGQMQKLVERGAWRMFLERCDAVLAYAYCEWFGLHVNQEVAYKNYHEQSAEIARLTAELQKLLPKDLPAEAEFSWTSRFHVSALIYGGPLKYSVKVPYDPPQYEKADYVVTTYGTEVLVSEMDNDPLGDGEDWERYKAGKNKGQPRVVRKDTATEKLKWGEALFQMPGLINLHDLPAVVKEKFLSRRAEFKGSQTLADGVTPVYSSSEEALKAIKAYAAEVAFLVDLSALKKDTSTYYLGVEYSKSRHDGAVSVPEAVDPTEQRQGETVRPQETDEGDIRPNVGAVAANAERLQSPMSDMPEDSSGYPPSTPWDASSAGPLPRDRCDSGHAVPHVQQSSGHDGRQPSGNTALCRLPKVGIDGVVKVTGMLACVGADSIVHHNLNSTATVTGRLSSSNPNLQNIPRSDEDNEGKAKSRVKEMFTSRFGADGKILEVDYSALEVVMLCALTGDMELLSLLQAGTDMHTYRLAYREGLEYDYLKAIVDDEDHPEHGRWKRERTDIKPLSFADQYGASPEGLAFNTGCSIEFARQFQENEARMFPTSRGYRAVIRAEVEKTGMEPGNLHREMSDDGTWNVYRRGYWTAPGGTRYSFRQHKQFDKDTRQYVMDYKDTQIANYGFQGEAGFMMAISMGRIVRHMVNNHWYGDKVCLINNVHDAAYLDAADADVGREAAIAVRDIMADAPRYMTELWPAYNMAHVPFPAAAEMGPSMFQKFHIH